MSVSPEYMPLITQASAQYNVPEPLLYWQIGQESSFNPDAYNPASGAEGIAQFIPSTAADFGIDPYNESQAIPAAAKYDAQLFAETGNWSTALQRYGTLGQGKTLPANVQAEIAQPSTFDTWWNAFKTSFEFVAPLYQNSLGNPTIAAAESGAAAGKKGALDIGRWATIGVGGLLILGAFLLWKGAPVVNIVSKGAELAAVTG